MIKEYTGDKLVYLGGALGECKLEKENAYLVREGFVIEKFVKDGENRVFSYRNCDFHGHELELELHANRVKSIVPKVKIYSCDGGNRVLVSSGDVSRCPSYLDMEDAMVWNAWAHDVDMTRLNYYLNKLVFGYEGGNLKEGDSLPGWCLLGWYLGLPFMEETKRKILALNDYYNYRYKCDLNFERNNTFSIVMYNSDVMWYSDVINHFTSCSHTVTVTLRVCLDAERKLSYLLEYSSPNDVVYDYSVDKYHNCETLYMNCTCDDVISKVQEIVSKYDEVLDNFAKAHGFEWRGYEYDSNGPVGVDLSYIRERNSVRMFNELLVESKMYDIADCIDWLKGNCYKLEYRSNSVEFSKEYDLKEFKKGKLKSRMVNVHGYISISTHEGYSFGNKYKSYSNTLGITYPVIYTGISGKSSHYSDIVPNGGSNNFACMVKYKETQSYDLDVSSFELFKQIVPEYMRYLKDQISRSDKPELLETLM